MRDKDQSIIYNYDYNRLSSVNYPDMGDVNYIYGEMGATDNRAGRLYRTEDESGWTEHYFGKLGEATRTVKSLNSLINGADPLVSETSFLSDYLGRI